MAIPTRWACRPSWPATALALLAATLGGCQQASEPQPTLAQVEANAPARARARALLRVALAGAPAERGMAALLWGLAACEADSPTSALTAFALAQPRDGAAMLASVRLEGALERSEAPATLWRRAAEAPWMPAGDAARLLLKGAETLVRWGKSEDGVALLPPLAKLPAAERWRWWGVRARAGPQFRAEACRNVLLEAPERFASLCAGESLPVWTQGFSPGEWATHAEAWRRAGNFSRALEAARQAGRAGVEVGARAALALRQPEQALELLRAADGPTGALLRAEAWRQKAWRGNDEDRRRFFPQVIAATDEVLRSREAALPLASQARLLQAEALVELGRWERGLALLAESDPELPRWEWVRRRALYLARNDRALMTLPTRVREGGSKRGQRLLVYWLARAAHRRGDRTPFGRLLEEGFPDLPALWAAQEIGAKGVAVELSELASIAVPPPAWAHPLLAWGRIADVGLGWRAELERAAKNDPAWLSWVELVEPRPLDAIPLLLRGEPRLLAGPWQGLPRSLLARYLPLEWKDDVERAAAAAQVPPWVLAGLVRQESAWNPQARSPAGAVGLAQLLPSTAAEAIRRHRAPAGWTARLHDPEVNLRLGAWLLADWRARFGGSWTAALACYNGGERRVRMVWERAGGRDGPEFVEALEVPETWDYVHRVVLFAEGYRLLYWPEGESYPWTSSKLPPKIAGNS